jgi:hypothetical protein
LIKRAGDKQQEPEQPQQPPELSWLSQKFQPDNEPSRPTGIKKGK